MGCFAAILVGWYGARWGMKKWKARRDANAAILLEDNEDDVTQTPVA